MAISGMKFYVFGNSYRSVYICHHWSLTSTIFSNIEKFLICYKKKKKKKKKKKSIATTDEPPRTCLFEVRRLIWVRCFSCRVYLRKISHLNKILFISLSLRACLCSYAIFIVYLGSHSGELPHSGCMSHLI